MAKQPASAPWYSGGTLHAARASEWRRATEPNRLATAADWAAKLVGDDLSCMEALRPYAEALKRCADGGSGGPGYRNVDGPDSGRLLSAHVRLDLPAARGGALGRCPLIPVAP